MLIGIEGGYELETIGLVRPHLQVQSPHPLFCILYEVSVLFWHLIHHVLHLIVERMLITSFSGGMFFFFGDAFQTFASPQRVACFGEWDNSHKGELVFPGSPYDFRSLRLGERDLQALLLLDFDVSGDRNPPNQLFFCLRRLRLSSLRLSKFSDFFVTPEEDLNGGLGTFPVFF